MVHGWSQGKSVEVWLDAQPLTKITRSRAQPRITGMPLVVLIAVERE